MSIINYGNYEIYLGVTGGKRPFVPVRLVQNELIMSTRTIMSYLQISKLEGFSIAKNNYKSRKNSKSILKSHYIYVDSFHDLLEKHNEPEEKLYHHLIDALIAKDLPVYHGEVMSDIGLCITNSEECETFEAMLSSLSEESAKKYGCMLTAGLYLRKTNKPPNSFFELANKLSKEDKLIYDVCLEEEDKQHFVWAQIHMSIDRYSFDFKKNSLYELSSNLLFYM